MVQNIVRLFFIILMIFQFLYCQGSSVSIHLMNGLTMSGELLSVRPQSLLISTIEGLSDSALSQRRSSIVLLHTEGVHSITVKGTSRILAGVGKGILIGAGSGMIVGLFSGDDTEGFFQLTAAEKSGIFGVIFGGIGLIAGVIVGIFESTPDRTIEPLPGSGFLSIRGAARYPMSEPNFISSIP